MTDTTSKSNANRIFAVVALAVVAVVATLPVLVNVTGDDMPNTAGSTPAASATQGTDATSTDAPVRTVKPGGVSLDKEMSASEALEQLSDAELEAIAKRNGLTLDDLKTLLERDTSVVISKDGHLMSPGGAR